MRKYLWLNLFAICTLILPHVYSVGQASSPGPGEAKLTVLSSTPERMVVHLQSPQYRIADMFPGETNHQQVHIPGAEQSNDPGRPQLPQVTALIGVPPEGEVEVKILADHSQRLQGRYRLAPAASPMPLKEDLQPGRSERMPDPGVYASNQAYPSKLVSVSDYAWLRDQRLARLVISPFQYQPASGRLTWHQDLLVEIRFPNKHPVRMNPTLAAIEQAPQPFDGILSQALLNADIATQWRNPETLAGTNQALANVPSNPDVSTRYRIAIDRDGIYRLSYAALAAAGLPVDTLDATTLQMTNQGQEVAIYVEDKDGDAQKLSPGEYVLFYGEKFRGERLAEMYAGETQGWISFDADLPDGTSFDWAPQFNATMLEKYTDTNVYWLKYGEAAGLRMGTIDGHPNGAPTAETFLETVRAEQNHKWKTTLFTSEETWFWDLLTVNTFITETTRTYTTTLPGLSGGVYTATLRGELAAETFSDYGSPDHHTLVSLNSWPTPLVDETWDGKSRYRFEAQFPQSWLGSGENALTLTSQIITETMTSDKLYFDWFEFDYNRLFVAENNQLAFQTPITGTWKYKIQGMTSADLAILNVTDAQNPLWIDNYDHESYIEFQVTDPQPANYHIEAIQDLESQQLELYTPPDLSSGVDYVLISPPEFVDGLTPLVSYRASAGLTAQIFNVDDLYNQFNYGIYHPIAIKNFLRYAFATWDQPPSYVVLVGDGHWNFKGYSGTASEKYNGYDASTIYMPPYLVWVDPWQGEVDSANLLATVVGDDPLADVAIARLPANSVAELAAMIDKIMLYENTTTGAWQSRSLFIADNTPDLSGDFPGIADGMIQDYLAGTGFESDKIYQDDYGCEYGTCPEVNYAITNTLSVTGTLLVNYIGHGSLNRWSNEQIFLNEDIPTILNNGKLPVILSMTCLDGYWSYPGWSSLIEEIVRTPLDGAVAAFSPTGLGVSTGHDALHRGFYDALFINGNWELGAAAEAAKLRLFARGFNFDLLHTFTIFGDPAMRLNNSFQFEAGVDDATKSGDGGETVAYQLTITNTSPVIDSFEITYSANTWPVELANAVTITEPVTSTLAFVGPLASGASATTTISVTVPIESANLASDLAQVTVTSTGDRVKWQTIDLSTTHVFEARMYLPILQRAD